MLFKIYLLVMHLWDSHVSILFWADKTWLRFLTQWQGHWTWSLQFFIGLFSVFHVQYLLHQYTSVACKMGEASAKLCRHTSSETFRDKWIKYWEVQNQQAVEKNVYLVTS